MDIQRIVVLVFGALVVLAVVRMIWSIYRIVWRNEQMESGGSFGRQMFGRSKDN
jgi:hypothetical protein